MRRQPGIAGATLIYGSGGRIPDMILALQFLLDDLRRDGREIIGVRLAGHSLRLRVENFELAASLSLEPLPIAAFDGVLRPVQADSGRGDWTHDLARGRLVHGLRHHRCALGVLLRARCADADESQSDIDLGAECRAVVAALIEASPPQFILWQATRVLFTLREFRDLVPPRLNAPGDPQSAIRLRSPPAPASRPALPEWARGRGDGVPDVEGGRGGAAGSDGRDLLPAVPAELQQPRSRLKRMPQRVAGRMFGRASGRRRPPELGALDRSQRRLGQLFRGDRQANSSAPSRRQSRRIWRLGCALLAISLAIVLPPLAGV